MRAASKTTTSFNFILAHVFVPPKHKSTLFKLHAFIVYVLLPRALLAIMIINIACSLVYSKTRKDQINYFLFNSYRFTTYQNVRRVKLFDGLIFETNILRVLPVNLIYVFDTKLFFPWPISYFFILILTKRPSIHDVNLSASQFGEVPSGAFRRSSGCDNHYWLRGAAQ